MCPRVLFIYVYTQGACSAVRCYIIVHVYSIILSIPALFHTALNYIGPTRYKALEIVAQVGTRLFRTPLVG